MTLAAIDKRPTPRTRIALDADARELRDDALEALAVLLRGTIQARGLTQREAAKQLGVDESTLCKAVNPFSLGADGWTPSLNLIAKVLAYCGADFGALGATPGGAR